MIIAIYLQCIWGNNYAYPEDIAEWTPDQKFKAIEGAKWGFAMEFAKITTVWMCKACLLYLYAAMTKGLPKYRKAVWAVSAYTAIGYVIVVLALLFIFCWPISDYWALPVPEEHMQCMTYRKYMIVDAVFNITSDAIMLGLPIPLVIKAKVPIAR